MEISKKIDEIRDKIYDYRIDEVVAETFVIFENIIANVGTPKQDQLLIVNGIMEGIISAFERKDYMFVADLMEFELRVLLEKIQGDVL